MFIHYIGNTITIFTFDLKKRLKIVAIISAMIAFVMAIGFWFVF